MTLKLLHFIEQNKSLFWDIPHPENLSILKIQERFMHYGNWENIKFLQTELGDEFVKNYKILRSQKRQNLPEKTCNFFDKYLHV